MATQDTSIRGYGNVKSQPSATYGEGDVILRLGNGGAGATGLLEALAYDFLSATGQAGSITWVANNSRNTQLALLLGHIDIALTYEREPEALAAAEGWSITKACIFHDHFVVAGPKADPADVGTAKSPAEALARIAESRSLFHSRQDGSATMYKEAHFWQQCGLTPWSNDGDAEWFKQSDVSPAEALQKADAAGAYLLTDRSTLLRQTGLGTISQTTVFLEPLSPHDELMNSCYALCTPSAASHESSYANQFVSYALTERAQSLIGSFGLKDCGLPLFAANDEGFARTPLRGGMPAAGKWTVMSN